jgi:predicted nucleic acid-binding protein
VAEAGSDVVRDAMETADGWFTCRIAFVETTRAVALAAGRPAAKPILGEWPAFGIVEVDQDLVEHAFTLALTRDLGSLDALHLAAALLLPGDEVVMTTWDRRLHAAALAEGLGVLPMSLD